MHFRRLRSCGVLFLLFVLSSSSSSSEESERGENEAGEFLICRQCGSDVADSHYLNSSVRSPGARAERNVTLFGRSDARLQTLVNPYGVRFEVLISDRALCETDGEWASAHSWFPGRSWKFCACPRCSSHVGWAFRPDETGPRSSRFYALIVDKLIGDKYADSLVSNPSPSRR